MNRSLILRVQRLEARYGHADKKLQRLAEYLHVPPERFTAAIQGREAEVFRQMGNDGTITWQGFLLVCKLLGFKLDKH